jgi:hypothetical protein
MADGGGGGGASPGRRSVTGQQPRGSGRSACASRLLPSHRRQAPRFFPGLPRSASDILCATRAGSSSPGAPAGLGPGFLRRSFVSVPPRSAALSASIVITSRRPSPASPATALRRGIACLRPVSRGGGGFPMDRVVLAISEREIWEAPRDRAPGASASTRPCRSSCAGGAVTDPAWWAGAAASRHQILHHAVQAETNVLWLRTGPTPCRLDPAALAWNVCPAPSCDTSTAAAALSPGPGKGGHGHWCCSRRAAPSSSGAGTSGDERRPTPGRGSAGAPWSSAGRSHSSTSLARSRAPGGSRTLGRGGARGHSLSDAANAWPGSSTRQVRRLRSSAAGSASGDARQ